MVLDFITVLIAIMKMCVFILYKYLFMLLSPIWYLEAYKSNWTTSAWRQFYLHKSKLQKSNKKWSWTNRGFGIECFWQHVLNIRNDISLQHLDKRERWISSLKVCSWRVEEHIPSISPWALLPTTRR